MARFDDPDSWDDPRGPEEQDAPLLDAEELGLWHVPDYPDFNEPPGRRKRGLAIEDEPVRPVDWYTLGPDEAEAEWLDLDRWVTALRRTYGLPPTVIPPFWHRHDELVWELSALHTHWRNCYDPDASGSAPCGWHRDFEEARRRLREWVSTCGTRVDRDRPTRQTAWPGEEPIPPRPEVVITDREEDFRRFVAADIDARRQREPAA